MLGGLLVQLLARRSPTGQKSVHMSDEGVVMVALEQVDEFVDGDILQAGGAAS